MVNALCELNVLDPTPVLGVSMSGIKILRLDQLGGGAPGNKQFKLQENIRKAQEQGLDHLVSFGGAWSNHLHALAATGRELGIRTTGVVRGEQSATPSAMLVDAKNWGMELLHVSREQYRQRDQEGYLRQLRQRLGPCYFVPEGGANSEGVTGCEDIAALLRGSGVIPKSTIVIATGTGTTLAGVARSLPTAAQVVGISVLKNALDIDQRVAHFTGGKGASWQVLHDYHQGGYARVNVALKQFILAFEAAHKIPLDPVYTGKALYAVHQLLAIGGWQPDRPIVFVHTGGLQGRRGFSWLT
jgi:1-aminocyclopropane-1-carboxylate deaminase